MVGEQRTPQPVRFGDRQRVLQPLSEARRLHVAREHVIQVLERLGAEELGDLGLAVQQEVLRSERVERLHSVWVCIILSSPLAPRMVFLVMSHVRTPSDFIIVSTVSFTVLVCSFSDGLILAVLNTSWTNDTTLKTTTSGSFATIPLAKIFEVNFPSFCGVSKTFPSMTGSQESNSPMS